MSQQPPQIDYMINRRHADFRHGTGVQIKLFAGQLANRPRHICWDVERSVSDTYRPVCNLDTSLLRVWPLKRGRGLVDGLETKLGLRWDDQERISAKIKQFTGPISGKPRAYVIVASEDEAKVTRQILGVLNAEYVVNVMDYLHLGETELSEFPEFTAVLKGAKKIFALTPAIRSVLTKISGRQDISLLAVAREPANRQPRTLVAGAKPFEIVMMGSVDYKRGLEELQKFCDGLGKAGVKFRLNYIGTQTMRERLGTGLPVNYCGVRLAAERDALLNTMHLAYLPGPDGDPATDYLARYSFPSRTTDYFWHGLPVVGPLFDDSATVQMVSALRDRGAWFSPDAGELAGVVKKLAENPQEWESASEAVHDFARQNFSMARTAEAIVRAFEN